MSLFASQHSNFSFDMFPFFPGVTFISLCNFATIPHKPFDFLGDFIYFFNTCFRTDVNIVIFATFLQNVIVLELYFSKKKILPLSV